MLKKERFMENLLRSFFCNPANKPTNWQTGTEGNIASLMQVTNASKEAWMKTMHNLKYVSIRLYMYKEGLYILKDRSNGPNNFKTNGIKSLSTVHAAVTNGTEENTRRIHSDTDKESQLKWVNPIF